MTGEITLRGNVLPIGGVKEKVLAARRARVTSIILPYQNRRDLDEVPKEPFKDIRFVFVENMRQVFREALGERAVMLIYARVQPRRTGVNLSLRSFVGILRGSRNSNNFQGVFEWLKNSAAIYLFF